MTDFSIKLGSPEKQHTGCVVVGVYETGVLSAAADLLDRLSNGFIRTVVARGDLDGKAGTSLMLHAVPHTVCDRVLLVGLGKQDEFNDKNYRKALTAAAEALSKLNRQLAERGIAIQALHPGSILTKLNLTGWGGGGNPDPDEAVRRVLDLAFGPPAPTGPLLDFRAPMSDTSQPQEDSFISHLMELRDRLIRSILAVVIKHLWASVLFLLFMSVVAAWTSATRITGRSRPPLQTALLCLLPVAAPTAVVTLAVALLGVVPAKGIAIIPTAGIMLGNAMIATSLAARHAHDELRSRHGEVEAALSLGFLTRDARLEVVRPAAATALIPGIDQTRSVGLVTIPGSFVGMVLGGASTTAAAIMQLFVLVALLAVAAIAVLTTTELVSRELL